MADYRKIIPFIRKVEGGLSKATTDNASKYCKLPDGSGYHTNKGITWCTFKDLAPKLGYAASIANFKAMPDNVWTAIFKKGYWDAIGGDNLRSQPIADLLVDYAWGFGPPTAIPIFQQILRSFGMQVAVDGNVGPQTINAANSINETALFNRLAEQRRSHFLKLNQPANEAGWLNRLKQLVLLKKKELGSSGMNLLVLAGLGYFGYKYLNLGKQSKKAR